MCVCVCLRVCAHACVCVYIYLCVFVCDRSCACDQWSTQHGGWIVLLAARAETQSVWNRQYRSLHFARSAPFTAGQVGK